VWALRDVKEGEELDWEYLDGSLRTGEERREETERILGSVVSSSSLLFSGWIFYQ
jgi:hypothetical protein